MFKFEIIHESSSSRARVGRIHTPHGIIETPGFVPVGTNATIKAVPSSVLEQIGIDLIFCNTYHLMLYPGAQTVASAGGLHTFMQRTRPIITDSGGFQVFSLAYGGVHDELKSRGTKQTTNSVLKISEEGVLFRSYRDGSPIMLTPETSVQAQKMLGADIIIPLDELPPYHIDAQALKKSFERTHRWQERSLREHLLNPKDQAMYAVIHGGIDTTLRADSYARLSQLPFDGYAIGGSLGKTHEQMQLMLGQLVPQMERNKPRHLLGIGDLPSITRGIALGIDTFDSSHPTKCARHGILFTSTGTVNITKTCYKMQWSPVDATCTCPTCTTYSAGYIHHLFKTHEAVAHQLASIHNLAYMTSFMKEHRQQILAS